MPAPLSVVIPTLNAAAEVAGLLGELMDGVSVGLVREVIVSDGGSTDDIAELAEAVGAEFVNGSPGRGDQLRRGVAEARGDWVLVLHADSGLPAGWADVVQSAMANPNRAYVFRLGFRAHGMAATLVAGWANLRTVVFGLPFGDQGLLISREMYAAAGGYKEIPLMEDVALIRALNGKVARLPAVLSTSASRYQSQGWVRRGMRNIQTQIRFFAGTDPTKLKRGYERGGKA